ncbi:hypothetical protein FRC96_09850 [Lujinxingia vulgaris]|uniref:Peptidase C-terminal archaeal/bacterial domain-containing protein n=1 Tax=Lujinxingia vulgaris TaxID=2600176 RepID=A0A5C6X3J6_9DELT|nr:PPC domain-containing protein [Lujinxingia vulgaris]TXD36373.1 hypothetical protein FRC96_09850 [Lujinxingia vulgaris]
MRVCRLLVFLSVWVFLVSCGGDEPQLECSESAPCERGACTSENVCDNAPVCEQPQDCLEGFNCIDGACTDAEAGLCEGVSCARGICDPESGQCVNDVACSSLTQETACLEAHLCVEGSCVSEADFCAGLGCERGTCAIDERACVNAERCDGDDARCLAGFYCADDASCQPNVCDDDGITCARGVCDPASGECVSAEACQAQSECLDGLWCVEGSCEAPEDACRGCAGNQSCDVDGATNALICRENVLGCERSVDCLDGRVCRAGRCAPVETLSCLQDGYEPNDGTDEATDLKSAQSDGGEVRASVCAGDVDRFTYNVQGQGLIRGVAIFELRLVAEDLGAGRLDVRLLDPNGDEVTRAQSDDQGVVRLEKDVRAFELGVYSLEVRQAESAPASGLRYSLYGRFVEENTAAFCAEAETIEPGIHPGDTTDAPQGIEAGECLDASSPARAYRFVLERPGRVVLSLRSNSSAALGLVLREGCDRPDGALACALAEEVVAGETLEMTLREGVYHAIVQGETATERGAYDLTLSIEELRCTPGQSRCVGDDQAEVCLEDGTAFAPQSCEQGCSAQTGACEVREGDRCSAAIDATGGFEGAVSWRDVSPDYDPGAASCLPDNAASRSTSEADSVYRVTLGPGQAVEAWLSSNVANTSLYVMENCQQPAASCLAGADSRQAELNGRFEQSVVYVNRSAVERTVFVVADSGEAQIAEEAPLRILAGNVICEPGATRCDGDSLQVCSPSGVAYLTERSCPFGCQEATLPDELTRCAPMQNDVCKGAVALRDGSIFEALIDDYASSVGAPGCDVGLEGPGALFYADLQSEQVLDLHLDAQFEAAIEVATRCDDFAGSCAASQLNAIPGEQELRFVAPSSGRYFVRVGAQQGAAAGAFTLSATVRSPSCAPGELLGCVSPTELGFCDAFGQPQTYACVGGCDQGACAEPSGDICADARVIDVGEQVTGDFRGINALDLGTDAVGSCQLDASGAGPETIFAVDVPAGQRLDVEIASENAFTLAYLMTNCEVAASCQDGSGQGRDHTLSYVAGSSDERVFVVVDRVIGAPSSSEFELTTSLQTPGCAMGAVACIDDATLGVCDPSNFYEPYRCEGGCVDGACAEPRGDICQDAIVLSDGESATGTWVGSDSLNPTEGCDEVAGEAVGVDTLYAVDLQAGDVLRAELDTTATTALLYLVDGCAGTSSCVSAASAADDFLYHVAEEAERVYLVVDRTVASPLTQNFDLSVSVEPQVCTPGTQTCRPDGATLAYCNPYGTYDEYRCGVGCAESACTFPTGTSCWEPVPLTDGEVATGDLVGESDFDLGNDPPAACIGGGYSRATPGADRFWELSLRAGQTLTAYFESPAADATLYVLDDCRSPAGCRARSQTNGRRGELRLTAEQDETIVMALDRTSTFPSGSAPFTFYYTLETGPCAIGAPVCVGDDVLAYCDAQERRLRAIPCESGCSEGACTVPGGDICQDAILIGANTTLSGDFSGTNHIDPPEEQAGQCDVGTGGTSGVDTIYAIDLEASQVLRASLTSSAFGETLAILESCDRGANACLRFESGSNPDLEFVAPNAGRYFLVVDRTSTSSTTLTFGLEVEVLDPQCTPGQEQCSADASALERCGANGLWESYPCSGGCADARCTAPDGASCAEAIALTSGQVVSASLAGTSAITPGTGEVGQCDFGFNSGAGPEGVYTVSLSAGEVLRAELSTTLTSALLYVLDDCYDASTCLNKLADAGPGTLYFQAPESGTYTLVVDSRFASTTADYTLAVDVQSPGSCQPGSTTCADNDQNLAICNALGVYDYIGCDGGCVDGACVNPTGDRCIDMIDATAGGTFSGGWAGTVDISTPESQVGLCDFESRPPRGRDTYYRVSLQAGEVLRAKMTTTNASALLYLLESCGQIESCLFAEPNPRDNELFFVAPEAMEAVLVVDTTSSWSSSATYELTISTEVPGCTYGARQCSADAGSVEVCNAYGVWESFDCTGPCLGGFCEVPSGDICLDAIALNPGDEFSGEFIDFSAQIDPRDADCLYAQATGGAGRDAVFALDLNAGDILEASVVSPVSNLSLYLLGDCQQSVDEACVVGRTRTSRESFTIPESGTYHLVVDTPYTWSSGAFTLRTSIVSGGGICQPGQPYCQPDGQTLAFCNDRGTQIDALVTCEYGCDRGRCASPPIEELNDSCDVAMVIDQSQRVSDTLTRFSDALTLPSSSCTGINSYGNDAFYAVPLEAGEVLRASMNVTSGSAMLYLFEDCADAEASCQSASGMGTQNVVEYAADSARTVYVGVDTTFYASVFYTLDFEIGQAECVPGQNVCEDGDTLQVCDGLGRYEEQSCYFGCASGACQPPPNDSCAEAIDATEGIGFVADLGAYTPLYSPQAASSCTGSEELGPEAVFSVDAQAYERIIVAMLSDQADRSLWISQGCAIEGDAGGECVAGVRGSAAGEVQIIEFLAREAGRYYIYADAGAPAATGEFSVDIWVESPQCQAGETACVDAQTLGVCNDERSGFVDYACEGGCVEGACTSPRGDICDDRITLSSSGTTTGDLATLTNTLNLAYPSCTGFDTPGPEALFELTLQAGEGVDAVARNIEGAQADLALYVLDQCGDAESCLAGQDAFGGVDETLSFTAPESGTYILVVDSYDAETAGRFELEVSFF